MRTNLEIDYSLITGMFCSIAEQQDPKDRMVQVVKWYLSAFHAGRKGSVAKKPYNPILGEVFFCHWDLPFETEDPSASVSTFDVCKANVCFVSCNRVYLSPLPVL